jgi:regulator of nucleoside diphosphate kinase
MTHVHELVLSHRDGEALARLAAGQEHAALAELMLDARFVADEALPAGCAGLGSRVTYAEERGGGAARSITLVCPEDADVTAGRISVLSPIGLALVGRRRGAVTQALLPNGRRLTLRVLECARLNDAALERRAA